MPDPNLSPDANCGSLATRSRHERLISPALTPRSRMPPTERRHRRHPNPDKPDSDKCFLYRSTLYSRETAANSCRASEARVRYSYPMQSARFSASIERLILFST